MLAPHLGFESAQRSFTPKRSVPLAWAATTVVPGDALSYQTLTVDPFVNATTVTATSDTNAPETYISATLINRNQEVITSETLKQSVTGMQQRAGFYSGLRDDFSRNGKRKIRQPVAAVPDNAQAVQVLITGVSVGLDGFSYNLAQAGKRAEKLAEELESRGVLGEYLVNVSATYTADGAERSLSCKADVLTTRSGKPLSTVTMLYREPVAS